MLSNKFPKNHSKTTQSPLKNSKCFSFKASFFTVVGKTGAGKSSFINALARKKICKVGSGGNSVTPCLEKYDFASNGHLFYVIDTAGLDDRDEKKNKEKIGQLKALLEKFPKIKKIIIVKAYSEVRLSKSIIESIITFMDSFPLKKFWEHVIIVNTFADTDSKGFKRFMEKEYIPMIENIKNNDILCKYMEKYKIEEPKNIKEYFLEPVLFMDYPDDYKSMEKDFDDILKDIENSDMIYKNVEIGGIEKKLFDSKINIKGFFVERSTRTIKCTDYDGKITKIVQLLEEKQISPIPPYKTEYKIDLIETKDIKWYDIISLGISWVIRDTKLYHEYEINYYMINNENGGKYSIKGEELFIKEFWR